MKTNETFSPQRKVLDSHRVLKSQRYSPYHINILSFSREDLLCQNQSYSHETSRTTPQLWSCDRTSFLNLLWNLLSAHHFRDSTVPSQWPINSDLHSQMPLSQHGWNWYLLNWVNGKPKEKKDRSKILIKKSRQQNFSLLVKGIRAPRSFFGVSTTDWEP